MFDFLLSLTLFNATVLLVPFFVVTYFGLKAYNSIWLSCASFLHPDVEFVRYSTVRTLLDTHRNQGIVSVLLSVRGRDHPEAVKRHLHEVVNRREKSGNLAFPRLQHSLVTRCGIYAWQRSKFDLEQHVTLAKFTYKGRAVTEFNIQEYVSEIISKYLPSGISPWQLIIIPTSEDHHYILLKIHHILLSEGVNIGDLLPLIPPTRPSTGPFVSKSPLVEVVKKPVALPTMREKLTEEISNHWNEFVGSYDPLEKPELLKDTPTLRLFLAVCIVTLVAVIRESRKGFRVVKPDSFSKLKYFSLTMIKETSKRQVSPKNFLLSILKTMSPGNLAMVLFEHVWFAVTLFPIRLPLFLYSESMALYYCFSLKYCPYPHTLVGVFYTYVPLLVGSLKEVLGILRLIFLAPRTIIQDILMQEESMQTITLCGRKAVAWSDPVKLESIKNLAKNLGVSETEVILSSVAMCLSKYFSQVEDTIPKELPITMRNINSNYLFATGPQVKFYDSMSGIICLNLPVVDPQSDVTQLENLKLIEGKFKLALEKQGVSHLLTSLQTRAGVLTMFLPSTFASIYLKYLSRKYVVTVTELTNRYPNVTQRTLWGQEVDSVIYWRPPQANTSISLCVNEYADHVKLGVMCDAQLVPHHPFLARGFPQFVKALEDAVSVNA
ncbi:uncharacterized protein LOC132699472 isoform X1 [Cylas formicarius]|uniref:uncharacterized protein LOC132699472 isoform X1 n=1 Tax=Cylas formicarius TaxID=197179 RepID=UPI0029585A2B|nr:uncharacterized protein LOC132699472 isoform X1 [Cylas formicarius]